MHPSDEFYAIVQDVGGIKVRILDEVVHDSATLSKLVSNADASEIIP